jgi:hypothetical protein
VALVGRKVRAAEVGNKHKAGDCNVAVAMTYETSRSDFPRLGPIADHGPGRLQGLGQTRAARCHCVVIVVSSWTSGGSDEWAALKHEGKTDLFLPIQNIASAVDVGLQGSRTTENTSIRVGSRPSATVVPPCGLPRATAATGEASPSLGLGIHITLNATHPRPPYLGHAPGQSKIRKGAFTATVNQCRSLLQPL